MVTCWAIIHIEALNNSYFAIQLQKLVAHAMFSKIVILNFLILFCKPSFQVRKLEIIYNYIKNSKILTIWENSNIFLIRRKYFLKHEKIFFEITTKYFKNHFRPWSQAEQKNYTTRILLMEMLRWFQTTTRTMEKWHSG